MTASRQVVLDALADEDASADELFVRETLREAIVGRLDGLTAGGDPAASAASTSVSSRENSASKTLQLGSPPDGAVWVNDSDWAGSQTGLGVWHSFRGPRGPSPSKASIGAPPQTRTAEVLGLFEEGGSDERRSLLCR